MSRFEEIKWNLPMPNSSPREFTPSVSPERSPTGLEYAPQEGNYGSELFKAYEDIATQQREQKANPLSVMGPDYNRMGNPNSSAAVQNIFGQSKNFSPQESSRFNPQVMPEIQNTVQSPANILTPEGAQQVDNSGFGPMAGLESPPQNQAQSISKAIEPNKNLYTDTAIAVSAKEAKSPEKPPEAPMGSPPMPPAASHAGRNVSEPLLGMGKDKNATLDRIAMSRVAYPLWMQQGLNG